jgi:dihydroxyacetone kinase-like predicted kinase
MFLIPSFSLDEVTKTIDSMGTSLVVTTGDDVSQVHIHLEDPAQAISKIRNIATPKNIRIELLEVTKRERAVVVQAFGSGVVQQLAELGAFVVACEPDERSSVSDFVDAAIHSDAKEIILVAGDRDSVQVTELAAKMLKEIGIQAAVVPAVSIPAALIAVSMFDESGDLKSATDKMIAACEAVTSVAISKANRDSGTAIGEIKSGNFLLLVESEIVAFGESIELLIEKFQQISAGKEIATIIWGAEISKPEQNSILAALNNLEVVSIDGGQELWLALVGLE